MRRKLFVLAVILVFGCLQAVIGTAAGETKRRVKPDGVRAVYLSSAHIYNQKKIEYLERIFSTTNANGIVIDFKDNNVPNQNYMAGLVKRFKEKGVYTIALIVTFQDSYFARQHPEIAIKSSSGEFWFSGKKSWKRYWLDPISCLAQDYNIEVAKRAIDAGFDEIQFDYIRFPTDGNMKDIRYPFFNPRKDNKSAVMREFFKKIHDSLKGYSPKTIISIDVYGEVLVYGEVPGIGQALNDITENFDVVCPMAYPSHYSCGEFGVQDPTAHPYKVYFVTLQRGLAYLKGKNIIIRPWVQDFSIRSIYGCGPYVFYDKEKVSAQI